MASAWDIFWLKSSPLFVHRHKKSESVSKNIFTFSFIIFLFAALKSPPTSHASVIFNDTFDTGQGLSNWQVSSPPPCQINLDNQNPSPQGGNNAHIYRNSGGGSDCYILYSPPTPLSGDAKVTFFFYDDMSLSGPNVVASIKSSQDERMWLGVRSTLYGSNYTYRIDDAEINSSIPRSHGWHTFQFYKQGESVFAAIDGVVLKKLLFTQRFKDIVELKITAGWESQSRTRIDNVIIRDDINTPPPITNLMEQNTSGNRTTLTYETQVTALTSSPLYFNSIFFSLSDNEPQESNNDIIPMFGIKKSGSTYKFYGLRWIGTIPQLGNPSINSSHSYRWDIGGFSPGTSQVICNNISRKATTYEASDSFACLNISESTITQNDNVLTIRWNITLPNTPDFIHTRNVRSNFPDKSTQTRTLQPYLSIDHPVSDFLSAGGSDLELAKVKIRYNWEPTGTLITLHNPLITDYRNSVELNPITSNQNRQNFTFTITHPTDAQKIDEIHFWADEIDPSAPRSDVAIPFALRKVSGQWRLYGRRYIGPIHICQRQPFDYTAEDCYLNYTYDVGGLQLEQNGWIYHHLNRNAATQRNEDALALLRGITSKVEYLPGGKKIQVILDIEAFERNGTRHMQVFTRWQDNSGISTSWIQKGKWNLNYPHQYFGQNLEINPKSDASGYRFPNGDDYHGIGLSHFYLYRTHTPEELQAYLAKMKLYGMDYVRLFLYTYNPLPQAIDDFLYAAHEHGIYVDMGIDNCISMMNYGPVEDVFPWIDWLSYRYIHHPSWFSWESCNDPDPEDPPATKTVEWNVPAINRMRAKNTKLIHTIQLQVDDHLGMAKFCKAGIGCIKDVVDDYSFRSFGANAEHAATLLLQNYNLAKNINPQRPVYVGESRLNYYPHYTVNQEQEQATENMLNVALSKNLSAFRSAIVFYRPEYEGNGQRRFPELSPKEWRLYLSFAKNFKQFEPPLTPTPSPTTTPPTPTLTPNPTHTPIPTITNTPPPPTPIQIPGDMNGDGILSPTDYLRLVDVYGSEIKCSDVGDLNNDCQINALDVNLWIKSFSISGSDPGVD